MNSIVTPARNIGLWVLTLFSAVMALLGTWVVLSKLPEMESVLTDGSATPAQVYGGQSWIVVGAAVLGAGIIGLTLALAVVAARPAVRRATQDVEAIEIVDVPVLGIGESDTVRTSDPASGEDVRDTDAEEPVTAVR